MAAVAVKAAAIALAAVTAGNFSHANHKVGAGVGCPYFFASPHFVGPVLIQCRDSVLALIRLLVHVGQIKIRHPAPAGATSPYLKSKTIALRLKRVAGRTESDVTRRIISVDSIRDMLSLSSIFIAPVCYSH